MFAIGYICAAKRYKLALLGKLNHGDRQARASGGEKYIQWLHWVLHRGNYDEYE